MAETIITTEYSEEMQRSYMNYSMSVITARAIPDARDGLKPVQRRVLYDMGELHLGHDKPHRKSARIVGDTMGKYHPHGDSSIYETLVVLSQSFKKGMPLVDGHGNFGSIEGDGAAAMRYTEARLQKFAEEVYLKDLDKTVRFVPNYDETEKEPEENTLVACFTSNIVHLHLLSLFVTAFQVIIYTYLFLSSASSLKAPSDNGSPEAPAPPLRCTLIPVLTHMPEKSGSWLPLR